MLEIEHVPVIYTGTYNKEAILEIFQNYQKTQNREIEGFVIRNKYGFNLQDFSQNVAKFVRANHVTTDEHWTTNWTVNPIENHET